MTIEKGLSSGSMTIVCPAINLIAYFLIGITYRWYYALGTFLYFVLLVIFSAGGGYLIDLQKVPEAKLNDERIKLVSDLIVGIRSIKCFAWENRYRDKVKKIRDS
jgi:ABC-type bacteriocin/lantibiotic exporter with double-glycine peptidase domain